MNPIKEAISALGPVENPVVYKRVLVSSVAYSEEKTPYLLILDRLIVT